MSVLTDVQTPLLGGVLSGVPVLPVFQLIVSALLLAKHNHHYTLGTEHHTQWQRRYTTYSTYFLSFITFKRH